MDKKQFILDTLLPYKENPKLCGYDNKDSRCMYLMEDGRKCAVGKHMKEGEWQREKVSYNILVQRYEPTKFFTDEALAQNLSDDEWQYIQHYHDEVAAGYFTLANNVLDHLEQSTGQTFPELRL